MFSKLNVNNMEDFLKAGHRVEFLSHENQEKVQRYYNYLAKGAVMIYPERILMPSNFADFADSMYNLKFREGDVLVQGYVKTGTSWTQEIVWTMLNNPNFDNPKAKQELFLRSPILEMDSHATIHDVKRDTNFQQRLIETYPEISFEESLNWDKLLEATPDRRIMKCHLPISFFHPKMLDTAKVIYLIRDPRDVCLSFFFHSKHISTFQYKGTLDEFVDAFTSEKCILMPGDFANHIRLWLEYKNHKKVHFIYYEDLKMNTMNELKKLNKFLNAKLSYEQLVKVKVHTSFKQMRNQSGMMTEAWTEGDEEKEQEGAFFRKGIVGDHKEKFSPEMLAKFDAYIKRAFGQMNLPYC